MQFDGVTVPKLRTLISLPGNASTDPQAGYYLRLNKSPGLDTAQLAGPVWTELPQADIQSMSIRIGQPGELDQITPSTATFVVDDFAGNYDPLNLTSPYNIANVLSKQDSDFEGGIGTWGVGAGGTPSAGTVAAEGTGSLKLTADGTTGLWALTAAAEAVSAGQNVTDGILVKSASASRNWQAVVRWLNTDSTFNSQTNGTSTAAGPTGWTQLSASGTAPVDGFAVIQFQSVTTPAANEIWYADQAQLNLTASLPTWIPGGTVGLDIGRPVWILADWQNVSYPLYYGFVAGIVPNYGTDPTVTFNCTDALELLGRAAVGTIGSSYDNDTTGVRAGRILDAAQWPSASRALDTGYSTCQATTFGDKALPLLQQVVDTELGRLYQDTSGNIVFYDRTRVYFASRSTTVQAVISDLGTDVDMVDVSFAKDGALLFNEARVTRNGGTEQVVQDASTVKSYGIRTYPNQAGPLLRTDADAFSMASWLVSKYKTPQVRIQQVTVEAASQGMWSALLPLKFLDRVRVVRAYGGATSQPVGTGPVVDASSPAGVTGTTNPSLTTASFTPPSGALLLALVGTDGTPDFNVLTLSDSLGGNWTRILDSSSQYGASIYQRTSGTTGAAMTVTVTGDHNFATGMYVAVITGQDKTDPIATLASNYGTAGTTPTLTFTTTTDKSLVLGVGTADTTTYTPISGTSFLYSWTGAAATAAGFMPRLTGNKTPPGQVTLGTTNVSPSQGWTLLGVEIQAPGASGGAKVIDRQEFIEGISHEIGQDNWTVTLSTSDPFGFNPLILNQTPGVGVGQLT
jgi:hypothetical protein